MVSCGSGSRVVKVSDRGWPCDEFEPSTTKDPPCRGAMHVKSVESSNVLLLVRVSGIKEDIFFLILSSLLGSKRFRSSLAMLPAIEIRRSQGTDDPTILIYIMAIG
ncbi:hypothetical protein TNCV_1318501 [Trichonephila clavipes]|nr:hypothetical protein TNCV_1318501 [Trichonephila clavipes]